MQDKEMREKGPIVEDQEPRLHEEKLACVDQDSTEHKRTQEALEKERTFLDEIIKLNPYSISIYDSEGHYLRGNQAHLDLFKAPPPPPDYSIFDDPIIRKSEYSKEVLKLKKGQVVRIPELWYNVHDFLPSVPDNPVLVGGVAFPILGNDGNVENIVVIHEDITERRKAEEALKESEEKYRMLIENSDFAICYFDTEGRFVLLNRKAIKGLGEKATDIIGKSIYDVFPEEADSHMQRFIKIMNERKGAVFEDSFELPGGKRWFSSNIQPVIDENGSVRGVQIISNDITERRKAEEEILGYQTRLKSLASELLLAGERERRRIAVGVHDQIGQQLVLLKLELQSLGALVSDTRVCSSLDKAYGLMDQIIGDARSLTFELSNPVLYEVGLDVAVESWLGQHIHKDSGLKYKLVSEPSPLKPEVETSIVLFGVIRELLANIVKHADANMVQMHIQESGQTIKVSIEDDGVGFELSKLDLAMKKTGGFGLFNARERIEYLGGSFEIQSKQGQGTCVRISVPVK